MCIFSIIKHVYKTHISMHDMKILQFLFRIQIQSFAHQFMFFVKTLYPQFVIAIKFLILKSSITQFTICSGFNFRSSILRPMYSVPYFCRSYEVCSCYFMSNQTHCDRIGCSQVLIYSQDKVYRSRQSYHHGISSIDLLPSSVVTCPTFVFKLRISLKTFLEN